MMNAKSSCAAAALNDVMARMGWHRYGVRCWPVDMPDQVVVQYRSDAHGDLRAVQCDALRLARWLDGHALAQGAYATFCGFLDMKEERPEPVRQAELDLGEDAPSIVRRSMMP